MDSYLIMAEGYEQAAQHQKNENAKKELEKRAKLCRILATFDEDDKIRLFSMGLFNDFVKGYCKKAMVDLEVDKQMIDSVMKEISWLIDTQDPKSILD